MTTSINTIFEKAIDASTKCIASSSRYDDLSYQGCKDFKVLNDLMKEIYLQRGIAYKHLSKLAELFDITLTHTAEDFYTTEKMIQKLCNQWDKFNTNLNN